MKQRMNVQRRCGGTELKEIKIKSFSMFHHCTLWICQDNSACSQQKAQTTLVLCLEITTSLPQMLNLSVVLTAHSMFLTSFFQFRDKEFGKEPGYLAFRPDARLPLQRGKQTLPSDDPLCSEGKNGEPVWQNYGSITLVRLTHEVYTPENGSFP